VRAPIAIAAALIMLAITAATASAASTRAEYVAQADPICQAGQAQEAAAAVPLARAIKRAKKHHVLKPSKKKLNRKVNRLFVRFFQQVVAIEHSVNDQIATIPPAPDDVSLIQVWLRARNELLDLEARLFASQTFRDASLKKVLGDFVRLIGLSYETTDIVRDFGFQYCSVGSPEIAIGATGLK
jgi:hypothetical protein